jgi:glycosyltransferase involved in cell wall biosynthesis
LKTKQFNNIPGSRSNIDQIVKYISQSIETAQEQALPEILVITTYPPKECGIATYSQDLIQALENKFSSTFSLKVCALEAKDEAFIYDDKVKYVLDTSKPEKYSELAEKINNNKNIKIVLSQHEFGFYNESQGENFIHFLQDLTKPVLTVFHTVLPQPDALFKQQVIRIVEACNSVIVMTFASKAILEQDYGIPSGKIEVIPHGTHLVSNNSKAILKEKYGLTAHKVLSTFGLMSSGKGIETTLDALPDIIKINPEVMFLVIGKTHPQVVKNDGEVYRQMLEKKVVDLKLENHVRFVNQYLSLPVLLEYLRLTDIYLFTSIDPNQAVSGTFSYAMSCGCAVISTPIPQASELLDINTGIIIEFHHSQQLVNGVIRLLNDEPLRKNMSLNTLHKIAPTAWENSAIAHALLLEKTLEYQYSVQYSPPSINLSHLKHMTTDFGMIQFSKINQPDIETGYTLDDNARALITMCMHYELTHDTADLDLIRTYLDFIEFCQQQNGDFLNYVNKDKEFTLQNMESNLDDANGRAIWALGYLISLSGLIPAEIVARAESIFDRALVQMITVFSPRAMAFAIKGLYSYQMSNRSPEKLKLLKTLANRLVQMYKHESSIKWNWFEGYLTYANSILPEAMLSAWILTGEMVYREIAVSTFGFLLENTFNDNGIEVISNNKWFIKGQVAARYGEQPIDVAYTIMTLSKFYNAFKDEDFRLKMGTAFNWFLGNNRLHQIVYNPCTGGCYDGLEESQVNLNQGAESTVSYLMARLTIENYRKSENSKYRWIQSRKLTSKSII